MLCLLVPAFASAQVTCAEIFGRYVTAEIGGQEFQYSLYSGATDLFYKTKVDDIRPDIDPSRRVLVAVSNGHTYLLYKGHRIDRQPSKVGRQREVYIRKSTSLEADAVFIVRDLSDADIAKFDATIENFERTSSRTCVGVVCRYLDIIAPGVVSPSTMRMTSLMKELFRASLTGKVEIVALKRNSLAEAYATAKRVENFAVLGLPAVAFNSAMNAIVRFFF